MISRQRDARGRGASRDDYFAVGLKRDLSRVIPSAHAAEVCDDFASVAEVRIPGAACRVAEQRELRVADAGNDDLAIGLNRGTPNALKEKGLVDSRLREET